MSNEQAKKPNVPAGMTKSEHADVPDWESCCATPEPHWQEVLEQQGNDAADEARDNYET